MRAILEVEVDATLDLLELGSAVLDDEGDVWQRLHFGWKVVGGGCEEERPTLPAKVIHTPSWDKEERFISALDRP